MACKPNSESLRCGAKYQMLVLIRKLNSSGFKSPAALLKRLTCLTHWGSESLALRLHWHSQWHTAQASANVRHWDRILRHEDRVLWGVLQIVALVRSTTIRRASRRYSQHRNSKPSTHFGCRKTVISKSQIYFESFRRLRHHIAIPTGDEP